MTAQAGRATTINQPTMSRRKEEKKPSYWTLLLVNHDPNIENIQPCMSVHFSTLNISGQTFITKNHPLQGTSAGGVLSFLLSLVMIQVESLIGITTTFVSSKKTYTNKRY
mmetsp:Transcript_20294/g.26185  ORF Transcript_20294/g.26185 Transcript_20294/m.26185 type:complete len:110 (-) Transcript_20294:1-330(-)